MGVNTQEELLNLQCLFWSSLFYFNFFYI
jgi:hypothetical protein